MDANSKCVRVLLLSIMCGLLFMSGAAAASRPAEADPIIGMLQRDIETPIVFVLTDGEFVDFQGFSSNAKIVDGRGFRPSGKKFIYEFNKFSFQYVPYMDWLMSWICSRLDGSALTSRRAADSRGEAVFYKTSDYLRANALTPILGEEDHDPFRVYDIGHFKFLSAKLFNEYTGVDPQSRSNTKFRSYREMFKFQPSPLVAKIAPNANFPNDDLHHCVCT